MFNSLIMHQNHKSNHVTMSLHFVPIFLPLLLSPTSPYFFFSFSSIFSLFDPYFSRLNTTIISKDINSDPFRIVSIQGTRFHWSSVPFFFSHFCYVSYVAPFFFFSSVQTLTLVSSFTSYRVFFFSYRRRRWNRVHDFRFISADSSRTKGLKEARKTRRKISYFFTLITSRPIFVTSRISSNIFSSQRDTATVSQQLSHRLRLIATLKKRALSNAKTYARFHLFLPFSFFFHWYLSASLR